MTRLGLARSSWANCPQARLGSIGPGSVVTATWMSAVSFPGAPISTSHAIQVVMVLELEPIRSPSTIYRHAARNASWRSSICQWHGVRTARERLAFPAIPRSRNVRHL